MYILMHRSTLYKNLGFNENWGVVDSTFLTFFRRRKKSTNSFSDQERANVSNVLAQKRLEFRSV